MYGTATNLLSLTIAAVFNALTIHARPMATVAFPNLLLDATVHEYFLYNACSSNGASATAGI